jgi:hypothetical protein
MKKILLFLFLCPTVFVAFAQEKADTVTNCCNKDTLTANSEDGRSASFPGGYPVYSRWLQKCFDSKEKILNGSNLQGKCLFRFLVDTTGRITDIQFCSMKGTLAETVIRDIFSKSPLWEPAVSNKRGKVPQTFCQSIDFQFGESKD